MNTKIENNNPSALSILKKIFFHLDDKRKSDIKFLFFLSILSSFAETISIAMLIPFISFFVNPESYLFNNLFSVFFDFFNIKSEQDILAAITFIFVFIVLLSTYVRIKFLKLSNETSDLVSSDFQIKIYKFLLNQNFSYYFKHGSNEIMSNLAQKSGGFTGIIFATLNIVNSFLISLSIIVLLVVSEPLYSPIIIITVISFFFIIFKLKSAIVSKKGRILHLSQNSLIDIFQNTVGYLPEIIVYNLKKFFLVGLSKLSIDIAKSGSDVRTIGSTPRIYLEGFVITFVVLIIYFSDISQRALEINISFFAILAFGAQKILPQINTIYNLLINFKMNLPSVESFLKLLEGGNKNEIVDHEYEPLKFKKIIKLENISFQYDKNLPNILNKFSFDILRGEKVAIKGPTGSGKTTLANIISGLFEPSQGKIFIDETLLASENIKNWQRNIAIVPQTVFLNDATVSENIAIALDVNSIDLDKVKNSARLAQIDLFIESLPNKYNEKVGERGVRLSGGQRQRMGIARALYRNAKIIILDEPTNALDSKTEKLVMDSISSINKDTTLIMISHSDNSLKYFDKIIDLAKFK